MCRYAIYGPYKKIYACFSCRKVFRQVLENEGNKQISASREIKCPQCSHAMHNMGHDFKAPKQSNVKQWLKVEILFQHGHAYHSCGCGGPGYRPKKLSQVAAFLARTQRLSPGEQLLRRIT